jgi:hypothetical protein
MLVGDGTIDVLRVVARRTLGFWRCCTAIDWRLADIDGTSGSTLLLDVNDGARRAASELLDEDNDGDDTLVLMGENGTSDVDGRWRASGSSCRGGAKPTVKSLLPGFCIAIRTVSLLSRSSRESQLHPTTVHSRTPTSTTPL